ncbi:MAG: hypothetical protein K2M04_08100 [Muribaculaceae bacterium]|nr:hypothetical protein [Muribaculaceae bacterium]
MRRILFYHLFLLTGIFVSSCNSSEEYFDEGMNDSSYVKRTYVEFQDRLHDSFGQSICMISSGQIRGRDVKSISGEEFIRFLISLPIEKLDSLYNIYCTPEADLDYQLKITQEIDKLINSTSVAEVEKIYEFAELYMQMGGRDLHMITEACRGVSPIIADCIIGSAAGIDEFLSILPKSRDLNSYCLSHLTERMAESMVENVVVDVAKDAAVALIAVPGADVVGGLVLAGMDLYNAIELAHEYNMCCATKVS